MTVWTVAEKARAVEVYVESANLGEAQRAAAREDGSVPGKNTIKRWVEAAGHDPAEIAERADHKTQQATRAAEMLWQDRRAAMLHEIGATADDALTICGLFLAAGAPSKAKDAATTMAILIDKAQVLSGDATSIVRTPWDVETVRAEAKERADNIRPLRSA